jgi:hypothetical protein
MSSITGVKIGHGFTVRFGVGATPAFSEIKGFEDITFPEAARADVDVTHNKSPNSTEESIPGLKPSVDWTATMLYVQGSADDVLIDGLYNSGDSFVLEITPPGGTPVQWRAFVKNYVPSLPVKAAMKAQVVLRINERIVPPVGGGS